MSAMQRRKGASGERELAALIREHTGWEAQRRVRNLAGDDDLMGVPGWSIEVKRYAVVTPGLKARWWQQAVSQAGSDVPVLFCRADRGMWRAVWPLAVHLVEQRDNMWGDYEWTVEGSIAAWAAAARECVQTD